MTVHMWRCTVPHHRLDTGAYVPEGTLLTENDPNVIEAFYVLTDYNDPSPQPKTTRSRKKA